MILHRWSFSCIQVVSLSTGTMKEQSRNRKFAAKVKKALLGLPKLRLLTCPGRNSDWGRAPAVELIVGLHRARWRRLYSEGNSIVYRRVLEPTQGE